MPTGQKHTIQCHCILPQYKGRKDPIFHKFVVFSVIGDDDKVQEKIVNCNNCGVPHRIIDICQSEIIFKDDESSAQKQIDDFKLSLPSSVFDLLVNYKKEVCDFEMTEFIIDNEKWGEKLILTRDELDGKIEGKILNFIQKDKYRVESYSWRLEV